MSPKLDSSACQSTVQRMILLVQSKVFLFQYTNSFQNFDFESSRASVGWKVSFVLVTSYQLHVANFYYRSCFNSCSSDDRKPMEQTWNCGRNSWKSRCTSSWWRNFQRKVWIKRRRCRLKKLHLVFLKLHVIKFDGACVQ